MNAYELEKVTLDVGCAERSCACYSPQFGDTDGVAYYPETVVRQQADRIAELEKTIKAHAIRPRGKSDATPFADVISQQADRLTKYGLRHQEQRERIAELEKEEVRLAMIIGNQVQEIWDLREKATPQTKPLSDEEIPVLGILHKAESVPLGTPIWETDAEFEKLKKIVITTVRIMEERILGNDNDTLLCRFRN